MNYPSGYDPKNDPLILYDPEFYDPLAVTMSFQSFDPSQGSLSWKISNDLEVSPDNPDADDWSLTTITIGGASIQPTVWDYLAPDGTTYEFAQPAPNDSFTWLLSRITDRNGNTLAYSYDPSTTNLIAISNSCGRQVQFDYQPGSANDANDEPVTGTWIKVYDSLSPPDANPPVPPVLKYFIQTDATGAFLEEVDKLTDRSNPDSYEATKYLYGTTNGGGDPAANANRLTDIFDPRGVRVLHNQYMTNADNCGDLLSQTDAAGRVTRWKLEGDPHQLTLTRTWTDANNQTVTRQVEVNHDASGTVSGVTQPADNPSTLNSLPSPPPSPTTTAAASPSRPMPTATPRPSPTMPWTIPSARPMSWATAPPRSSTTTASPPPAPTPTATRPTTATTTRAIPCRSSIPPALEPITPITPP